jgi:heat shock protein HslJ
MKSTIYLITILLLACSFSCRTQQANTKNAVSQGDNSMTSLDWPGTYQGILPCADCEGIKTQLVLNGDLTYNLTTSYLGEEENRFETKGTFAWDKSGSKITLDNSENQVYQVGENKLFHLDKNGNRITGDLANYYIIHKEDMEITGKYWKLIELNGETVDTSKDAFIKLLPENGRFTGNSSCNVMNGSVEISNPNGITFSKIIMTRMACIEPNVESEFVKTLAEITNYTATSNELILKDANENILAKFEADFFK